MVAHVVHRYSRAVAGSGNDESPAAFAHIAAVAVGCMVTLGSQWQCVSHDLDVSF